jgi:hypothetical protein
MSAHRNMPKKSDKTYFLIHYRDTRTGEHQSIKAKNIKDSSLGLSFVAISDFLFDEGGILVNPDEEAKKLEFESVRTLHLSIYSILSVSEIGEHKKNLTFKQDKSNLFVLNNDPAGK